MSKLEQAARQIVVDWDSGIHLYEAITALREALAEQVEQEPVARVTGYYSGRCVIEPLNRATVLPTDMALYAAPVQQVTRADLKAAFKEGFERAADLYAPNDVQDQAEQEPFAYEVWDENDQVLILIYASYLKEAPWLEEDDIIRKLYASPVRTKDLTEPLIDELRECRDLLMCVESCSRNNFENLAYERVQAIDAVIAVDREKNK